MSRGLFIGTAVLVLGYRVLVVSTLEPTDVFELLLNLMGLTFLGAAIYTYWVQRLAHAGLAAGYLAMGALHWGGYYVFGGGQVISPLWHTSEPRTISFSRSTPNPSPPPISSTMLTNVEA